MEKRTRFHIHRPSASLQQTSELAKFSQFSTRFIGGTQWEKKLLAWGAQECEKGSQEGRNPALPVLSSDMQFIPYIKTHFLLLFGSGWLHNT